MQVVRRTLAQSSIRKIRSNQAISIKGNEDQCP